MVRKIILCAVALCLSIGCGLSSTESKSSRCIAVASDPNPADGAKGVSPDTRLTWSGPPCAASYNVHFGTSSPPPLAGNQSDTVFDPGPLDWDRTYYWRIDIVDVEQGPIWKFTTFWYGDPNAEEMEVRHRDDVPSKTSLMDDVTGEKECLIGPDDTFVTQYSLYNGGTSKQTISLAAG